MTLRNFLEVLAVGMPFTVATENGHGWISYYDGEHKVEIPDHIADRSVVNVYPREGREAGADTIGLPVCELKAGLGIIVEGYENGKY